MTAASAPQAPARLPDLVDLTIPQPGSTTAAQVLSAAIRRLLGDLGMILRPRPENHVEATLRGALRELIRATRAAAPGALFSVLRRADVGVWIRCLRPGATAWAAVDPDLGLRHLAFAITRGLAAIGGLPPGAALTIPGPLPRRLASLTAREVVDLPVGITAVKVDAAGLSIIGPGVAPHDRDRGGHYHGIAGAIVLATVDDNPLATHEAHPDKSGNAIDLGDASPATWTAALAAALAVIGEHLPELSREIELYIQQMIPVGVDHQRHLSASYHEAIGTIYLSLHPGRMTLAEAVIHEFSHNKLNALFESDPVLTNGFTAVARSPVRPDPRPLHGILLAVHAFLPVARLYEALIDRGEGPGAGPEAVARLRRIVAGNHEGAAVLRAQGQPTAVGRDLLAEIDRWDRHFTGRWLT